MWPFNKKKQAQDAPRSLDSSPEASFTRSDRSPLSAPFSAPISMLSPNTEDEESSGLGSLEVGTLLGDIAPSNASNDSSADDSSSDSSSCTGVADSSTDGSCCDSSSD